MGRAPEVLAALEYAAECGFNVKEALEELEDVLSRERSLGLQVEELHRHNDRLHRRLEQDTDRDSLLGEVRKLRGQLKVQRRRAERAESVSARLRQQLQLVVAERDEASRPVAQLVEENVRLKAAYDRLVERLRLATPKSLMEVTSE